MSNEKQNTVKKIVSENDVPLFIRNTIKQEENKQNKIEQIRAEIQESIEIFIINNITFPLTDKDTSMIIDPVIEIFNNMRKATIDNMCTFFGMHINKIMESTTILSNTNDFIEKVDTSTKDTINAFYEELSSAWDTYLNVIDKHHMNIENDILKVYADVHVDKIIETIINKGKLLKYVGGEFQIYYVNKSSFAISYTLYFKDKNEKWTSELYESEPLDMEYLIPDTLKELKEKRKISIEF